MADYTATLRGVTIGEGTSYRFKTMPDVFTHSPYRTSRQQRTDIGAAPAGSDTLPAKRHVFEVQLLDAVTAVEPVLQALIAAWAPVSDSDLLGLDFQIAGNAYTVFGRPLAPIVSPDTMQYGRTIVRLSFDALDPRLYSASESSIALGLTGAGGRTYPKTYPRTYGAGGDDDGTITNAGTFDTIWTAAIDGPVITPRITLSTSGEFLELDGTIPTGSTVTVESRDGSVLLDGSPRPGWITLPSTMFSVPPAAHTIKFRAASGSGGLTFALRDAYL